MTATQNRLVTVDDCIVQQFCKLGLQDFLERGERRKGVKGGSRFLEGAFGGFWKGGHYYQLRQEDYG